MSKHPLTEKEVDDLFQQGFQEGDFVPGKGILTPTGTFRDPKQGESGFDFDSFESQVKDAQTSAAKIQEGINKLKDEQNADTTGVVSSSDEVVQEEKSILDEINEAKNAVDTSDLEKSSQNILDILEQERRAAEAAGAAQVGGINARFQEAKRSTEKAQEREKGTFRVTLARIGGFLGPSASALGALQNLASDHRAEINALRAKRDAAISAARAAVSAKTLQIARLKAQEVKSLEKEIEDRRNDFFDNALSIIKERRQQQENARQAMEKFRDDARQSLNSIITNFGGIDIASLDPATVEQLFELADVAEMPIELLTGRTVKQQQNQISNAISAANLSIRQDAFNLSLMKFSESEKLSALDAQRLGLPRGLVGVSENAVEKQLQSPDVPSWYLEMLEDRDQEPENQEALDASWSGFRNEILKSNPLIDFGGVGLPPTGDITD